MAISNVYVKQDVSEQEYEFQRQSYALGYSPEVIEYNAITKIMVVRRIDNMCVADWYGDSDEQTPDEVWVDIKRIVRGLYKAGLEYVDITGYNFVQDRAGKVWIIDFGHCRKVGCGSKPDAFVQKFMKDESFKKWNPEFR